MRLVKKTFILLKTCFFRRCLALSFLGAVKLFLFTEPYATLSALCKAGQVFFVCSPARQLHLVAATRRFMICLLGLGISCLQISHAQAESVTIKVAGSTTVLPIVVKTSEKFMSDHPGVKITVNPGGSGVGVKSLGNGLVDIGMISRQIDNVERINFPKVNFKEHVVGIDAVACVISSEVYDKGVKTLSKDQIRKIYSGETDNWKEVGGPDKKIFCIDKERHRGTRHVFMAYVFGDKKARARGADLVSGSNNEEQTKIALSDTAIGMLSQAWINKDVKGVGIKENNKIIEPSIQNIRNGTYPISRNLTLITNGEPKGFAKKFINYILSPEGQKIVESLSYVPVK